MASWRYVPYRLERLAECWTAGTRRRECRVIQHDEPYRLGRNTVPQHHAPPQSMTRFCESAARLGRWPSALFSRRSEGRRQLPHSCNTAPSFYKSCFTQSPLCLRLRLRHLPNRVGERRIIDATTLLPKADSPSASGRLDWGGGRRRCSADGRRGVSSYLIPPAPSSSTAPRGGG